MFIKRLRTTVTSLLIATQTAWAIADCPVITERPLNYCPGGICIPNRKFGGYYPTHWRSWPDNRPLNVEDYVPETKPTPARSVQPEPIKLPPPEPGRKPTRETPPVINDEPLPGDELMAPPTPDEVPEPLPTPTKPTPKPDAPKPSTDKPDENLFEPDNPFKDDANPFESDKTSARRNAPTIKKLSGVPHRDPVASAPSRLSSRTTSKKRTVPILTPAQAAQESLRTAQPRVSAMLDLPGPPLPIAKSHPKLAVTEEQPEEMTTEPEFSEESLDTQVTQAHLTAPAEAAPLENELNASEEQPEPAPLPQVETAQHSSRRSSAASEPSVALKRNRFVKLESEEAAAPQRAAEPQTVVAKANATKNPLRGLMGHESGTTPAAWTAPAARDTSAVIQASASENPLRRR